MKKVFWIFLLSSSACAAGLEWAGWAKNTADNGIRWTRRSVASSVFMPEV